ncbi:MAG: 4'-phosphopantetheinyl transferase superfamily protein [Paralcaligenes sp.]
MSASLSSDRSLAQLYRVGAHVAAGVARLDTTPESIAAGSSRTWLLPLTADEDLLAALWTLLARNERDRANAFRAHWVRNQFVHVRGVLRLLLQEYLGKPAVDIDFDYGPFGKPAVACVMGWHFNVAHSGSHALLTIANGYEVGVDIEKFRASAELESLARMVLSQNEMTWWQVLSEEDRMSAFFAVWTGKEAVAKAVGQGLRLEFSKLEIGLMPGSQANVRVITMDLFGACRLVVLPAPPGYAAALAARVPV